MAAGQDRAGLDDATSQVAAGLDYRPRTRTTKWTPFDETRTQDFTDSKSIANLHVQTVNRDDIKRLTKKHFNTLRPFTDSPQG
ncbi:hypothetical protein ACS0PU_002701 [Formica fusca]